MNDDLLERGQTKTVHLERDYTATPAELWQAWTDPVRLARWLGSPDGPLLGADQPVRLILGEDPDQWADVRVVAADEPRMLELTWDFPGLSGSRLQIRFIPLSPGRTRLIIDHHGLGSFSAGYGAGWQAYLDGSLLAETGAAVTATWEGLFTEALPAWKHRAASLP